MFWKSLRCGFSVCMSLLVACSSPTNMAAAEIDSPPTVCTQALTTADSMDGDLRQALIGLDQCPKGDLPLVARAEILLNLGEEEEARRILTTVQPDDAGLDSRRLFLLFGIARVNGNMEEMRRISELASTKYESDPQARIMRGVVACVNLHCKDALADLELANEQVQIPLGAGYLMAAYADVGRIPEAVQRLDQLRSREPIQSFDTFLLYAGVYVYLKSDRKRDAETLYRDFVAAFPNLEGSGFVWRARKLIDEGLPPPI